MEYTSQYVCEWYTFQKRIPFIKHFIDSYDIQEEINEVLIENYNGNFNSVKRYFSQEFDGDEVLTSKFTRSEICFGGPLEGYQNVNDRSEEQRELFKKWALGGNWHFKATLTRYILQICGICWSHIQITMVLDYLFIMITLYILRNENLNIQCLI